MAAAFSIEQTKVWISDMFGRVGSSFSRRRTQPELRLPSSYFNADTQSGRSSAPEPVIHAADTPNLNSLKESFLRGFGGHKYYDKRDAYDYTANEVDYDNIHFESLGRNAKEMRTNVPRCSTSFTSLKAVLNYHISKTERTETEIEIVGLASAKNGNAHDRFTSVQQYSADSGVSMDDDELFGEQHVYGDGISTSLHGQNEGAPINLRHETKTRKSIDHSFRMDIEGTGTVIEEKISKNYSVFCEKISNLQKESSSNRSTNRNTENARLLCLSLSKTFIDDKRKSNVLSDKEPKVNGIVTLDLQHFKQSRQLRVVLLSVRISVEHNRKMFCKVTLIGNRSSQKEKTRKLRSNMGNADFNETFYMNSEMDDLYGYGLKVQLCTVSRILQRQSTTGVAYIALEDIDLTLDTTMSVKLRDPKSSIQASNEEDLEIISENRSLYAEAAALLQESDISFPRLSRHQSLPHMHRDGVFTGRPKRSNTLESKVQTTVDRQGS